MKTFIKLSLMALLAILFFNGCRKDTASKTTNQLPVKTIATSGTIPDDMVMTPRGLMPKSQVHLVETGYHLELRDDHVMKIKDGTGELKEDFGEITLTQQVQTVNPSPITKQPGVLKQTNLSVIQPNGTGWTTYSEWNAGTSIPIGSFSTTWNVPAVPTSAQSQVVYIGNGISSAKYTSNPSLVIQTLLEWGNNGIAATGNSWTVSSWCSWSSGAAYTTPQAVTVSSPALLGVITLTAQQTGGSYNYTAAFSGISGTSLTIVAGTTNGAGNSVVYPANIPLMNWAYETLEAYNFGTGGAGDYPNQTSVNMTAIALQTGLPGSFLYPTGASALSWSAVTGTAANYGEHTANINNTNTSSSHGTVDLYFRYAPPAISYPSSSYTWSTCGPITPITPTNTGGGGVTYTVSPALPAGLSINSTTGVISGTPMAASAAANYTVTATNTGGTSSKTLTITITGPGSFTYPNIEFHAGAVVTPVSPTVSGTAPTHYTISPALPSNLSINPNTGVISGTAPSQAAAAVNYTVTGTAGTCSSTATASIAIDFQFTFTNNISNPNSGTNPDYGDISITFKNIPSGIEYGDGVFLAGGGKDVFWCPPGNYYVVINPGSSQFPNSTFISFGPSGPSNGGNPGHTFTSVPLSQGNTYLLNIQ